MFYLLGLVIVVLIFKSWNLNQINKDYNNYLYRNGKYNKV